MLVAEPIKSADNPADLKHEKGVRPQPDSLQLALTLHTGSGFADLQKLTLLPALGISFIPS